MKLSYQARDLLKAAKQDKDENAKIICIDLQQIQPVPKLSTGVAYYKRKLGLYNCCVTDLKANVSTMFVWDETQGGRGADEIASCVTKWIGITQQNNDFTSLTIFADNCGGQNKNKFIILAFLREMHMKRLTNVRFIYMVSGHSYLPCDASFGNIEKKYKLQESILTPEDYIAHIKDAVRKKPFPVVEMRKEDFFDFKILLGHVTWRDTGG